MNIDLAYLLFCQILKQVCDMDFNVRIDEEI